MELNKIYTDVRVILDNCLLNMQFLVKNFLIDKLIQKYDKTLEITGEKNYNIVPV